MPAVFHVVIAEYRDTIVSLNYEYNHASVKPHWLWYCKCKANLPIKYILFYALTFCQLRVLAALGMESTYICVYMYLTFLIDPFPHSVWSVSV